MASTMENKEQLWNLMIQNGLFDKATPQSCEDVKNYFEETIQKVEHAMPNEDILVQNKFILQKMKDYLCTFDRIAASEQEMTIDSLEPVVPLLHEILRKQNEILGELKKAK
jgi:hypothetical protein